jgi:hypothetical protein
VNILNRIVRGETEIGEHFSVRNSLAAMPLKPSLRRNSLAFLLGLRLIIHWSVGNSAGDGIEYGLEEADDAVTCRGARRSISSWACCLVSAKVFL